MPSSIIFSAVLAATGLTQVDASAPPSNIVFSTNGRCGPDFDNTVCPGNQCCSKWGWCGEDPQWCSCAAGCDERSGGRCGWPVANKMWGEHFCSVPPQLEDQFKNLFPDLRHDGSYPTDMGSDLKKLVRALDRGVNPISMEKLYNIAQTAKQSFPQLEWQEFAQSLLELHNFFSDDDAAICDAVEKISANFKHPTFAAVARDLVIMQTATKETLTLRMIVDEVLSLQRFASQSTSSINEEDINMLAECVAALGRAFDNFNLADLRRFMETLDQKYSGVTFSELAESLASLKDMAAGLSLQQIGDQMSAFASDWNSQPPLAKLPLDMLCDTLTTLHYAYGTHTDLGGALTSLITLKRTFDQDANIMHQATLPWIKKEMLRLQHGTPQVPDTLMDVTNSVVAIKNDLYSKSTKVSLPQIVEYILIMYQFFGKQEPSLKSLIDKAKEAGQTFAKYSTGSIADDPFFDAQAMAQFAQHFGQTQVLPLSEVVKTFEGLHSRFSTASIPSMCRDLVTLQYSGDQLGTIVSYVEKIYDSNKNRWKDLPELNLDDMASGMHALQGHGTYSQNAERYLSGSIPFHKFVAEAQQNMQQNIGNSAPVMSNPSNNYNNNNGGGSVGSVTAEKTAYQRDVGSNSNNVRPNNNYNSYNSYNPPQQPYVVPGSEPSYEYGVEPAVHSEGHSWFFWFIVLCVAGAVYWFWPAIIAFINNQRFNGAFDSFSNIKYENINMGFEMPPYGSGFSGAPNDDFDL